MEEEVVVVPLNLVVMELPLLVVMVVMDLLFLLLDHLLHTRVVEEEEHI
jgi:DUF438 domain-containing protein